MLVFLWSNLSTILIGLAVLGIVLLAVRSIKKDKEQGKSCGGCQGGCSGCPGAGMCHTKRP